MEFRVLGPLEVWGEKGEVALTSGRQRTLLAALLLHANRLVPVDVLVERLWDGSPPGQPLETILTHVMRLRRALGPAAARVVTLPGGYRIEVADAELDLDVFDERVAAAAEHHAVGDRAAEVADLRVALAQWRGEPLTNVPSDSLRQEAMPALVERRLQAVERHADASLAIGVHEPLVTDLRALVADHPYRERLRLHLMSALHRSGRTAEALDVYAETRRLLADDLGVEPSDELRRLRRAILDDRAADPGAAVVVPAPRRPAQLPPRPRLVGRADELAALDAIADAGPPAVAVVSGLAGVGKTALALAWAHAAAARFPDGVFHARLHGHVAGRDPEQVDGVLRRFVGAIAPPAPQPACPDELAAKLRSELAGRRVLVVLDDAASAEQVRPLLPASPGSVAIVTSRSRLTGLVAHDGARPLPLDPLAPAAAVSLLRQATGRSDPALAEVASLCGNLPLALCVVAARLVSGAPPGHDQLGELLRDLRDERTRLATLALDDGEQDVPTAFGVDIERLDAGTLRVLRAVAAAASRGAVVDLAVAESDAVATCRALATLRERSLVRRVAGGHVMHPLLALVARHDTAAVGATSVARRRGAGRVQHGRCALTTGAASDATRDDRR